jgi:hypothetical protein
LVKKFCEGLFFHIVSDEEETYKKLTGKAGLLNKTSSLAAALGVTRLIAISAKN